MENPDTYRAGKDLVEFEWRQNHRNFYSCFSLKFYREKDMPLLTGRFPDQSGDEIQKFSGSHAEALETLVLRIAEEAYSTSNLETE